MNKILLLGIILLLSGCSKEDKGNNKWDPNAMISLRAQSVRSVRAEGHLTPLEIVEKTTEMQWRLPNEEGKTSRGFSEPQRDFANERLLMWGTDIIRFDGKYVADYVEGFDVVLIMDKEGTQQRGDTIAYIPNRVLRAAAKIIKPAYDSGDYATCYKTFDEAFTFIPITGAEWRALKDKNEN